MRVLNIFLLTGLLAPGFAHAIECPAPNAAQPLRPTMLAPIASELALASSQLGAAGGVLSQSVDESQSVDQVLLRIRIESCRNMALVTPAPNAVPGVVSPDDPAAYKPRTEFDNTPWRFNMSQNGKNMTADEFSAWMKSKGVRVARGNATPAAVDSSLPAPPPATPASQAPPTQSPQAPAPKDTPAKP